MILLVDDDRRSLRPYCEELEARGWECELIGDIDTALRTVKRRAKDIELVVFDMMMPVGKAFAQHEHDGGLRTGALFHQSLRLTLPDVPAMLFTNRNIALVDGPFREDPRCECRMKEELLPGAFADHVRRVLGQLPRPDASPRRRGGG